MKVCSVAGCESQAIARGLCNRHRLQIRLHGKTFRTKYDPNPIEVKGDYAEVLLFNMNSVEVARTKIDIEDVERVSKHRWALSGRYACSQIVGMLHRFVMQVNGDVQIDHLNDGLDNRKQYLRTSSQSENCKHQRMKISNRSGYKGVSWNKRRRMWAAQITSDYKHVNIGFFENPREAAIAYDVAALKLHGEFSYTNKMLGLL